MRDYAAEVDIGGALALEAAAARNCSALFVRGAYGRDLGLGSQLYASSSNYKTAQVIDFETEEDLDAFSACEARLRRAPRSSSSVRVLIPASSCPEDAPGSAGSAAAVMDVFAIRAGSSDASSGKRLVSLLRNATDRILFALGSKPWTYYDFLGKAEAAAAAGSDFALVGGSAEFESVNFLRAFWAYVHGPPSLVSSVISQHTVLGVVRVQMAAQQLKGSEGLPGFRLEQAAASTSSTHAHHLAFSSS